MAVPTAEQIADFRRDGFVVLERLLEDDEVAAAREHFGDCFAHRWETGLQPDEVNYQPGVTPDDRTRQLCNVWKADRRLAATTLAARNAELAARLWGCEDVGLRLAQDNAIWKPPGGKALLAHQDAAYTDWLEPKNMITYWMALDDTAADSGTIYYVRGSNHWPRSPSGGQFHAPEDWLGYVRQVMPEGTELDLVPIEVPAGGAAVHDGWTFHGSPPNERDDRERRAIVSHMIRGDSRWNPAHPHPIYSKYQRPGELKMDEAFYPVMWRGDGYRSAWLEDWCTTGAAA